MNKLHALLFAAALAFALPSHANHDGTGPYCERHNPSGMVADTDNDGTIDWEEAHDAFIKHFEQMDTNQDGVLSADEIKGCCMEGKRCMDSKHYTEDKACKRHGAAHDKGSREFEAADKDKDGTLDRKEAKKLPRVSKNFDAIDTDRDGTIDRDEVHHFMREHKGK